MRQVTILPPARAGQCRFPALGDSACPLLALSGQTARADECPLFGVKQISLPYRKMSANDPIGANSLSPHDLFVLSPAQKMLSQKIFQIRSRSCPVPGAVGTDPDVDVWVEQEARQQTMNSRGLQICRDKDDKSFPLHCCAKC
jgi:hypothetical protein